MTEANPTSAYQRRHEWRVVDLDVEHYRAFSELYENAGPTFAKWVLTPDADAFNAWSEANSFTTAELLSAVREHAPREVYESVWEHKWLQESPQCHGGQWPCCRSCARAFRRARVRVWRLIAGQLTCILVGAVLAVLALGLAPVPLAVVCALITGFVIGIAWGAWGIIETRNVIRA